MSHKISQQQSQDWVIESPWQGLKQLTSARIALGRAGSSIPTQALLGFQLDHAKAMDAVHKGLDVPVLLKQYQNSPLLSATINAQPFVVRSKAADRMLYLQRPDLGRQIEDSALKTLSAYQAETGLEFDLAVVIADGLSATAIQKHAIPVLENLLTRLSQCQRAWSLAPITVATQARVAAGDDIGAALKAKITLIMIGERPGLTSPDSMGIYMTWNPQRGSKDSARNCISNIRPEGLDYKQAADKAYYLLTESFKLQLSGVGLKDRSQVTPELPHSDAVSDAVVEETFLVVRKP